MYRYAHNFRVTAPNRIILFFGIYYTQDKVCKKNIFKKKSTYHAVLNSPDSVVIKVETLRIVLYTHKILI